MNNYYGNSQTYNRAERSSDADCSKLRAENADLRQQVESLRKAIKAHREFSKKQYDRARAAEAALEQHKYDKLNHFNAVETLNEEIHDRDCTIAALREVAVGLVERFHTRGPGQKDCFICGQHNEVMCSYDPEYKRPRPEDHRPGCALLLAQELLSSPNPGARVEAVLQKIKPVFDNEDLWIVKPHVHNDCSIQCHEQWDIAAILTCEIREAVRALDKREESGG